MPKLCPVVLISDDNFIMQTCVTVTSLLEHAAPDTQYVVHVVMADCSPAGREKLAAMPGVQLTEASLAEFEDIRQIAHISTAGLLKFGLCELFPQYDKLLFLDGDMIVREDLSALFDTDLTGVYAAAVPEIIDLDTGVKRINSGFVLFNCEKMRREGMRQKLLDTRRSLGERRSMDQQSFNLVWGTDLAYFPVRYNCIPIQVWDVVNAHSMAEVNVLYGTDYASPEALIADAAVLHYATELKPWLYVHAPYGEEWYETYLRSPYKDVPLKRYSKWGARFHRLHLALKKGGAKGLAAYLRQGWAKWTKKDDTNNNIRNSWG